MSCSEFDAASNFLAVRIPKLSVLYNGKSNYFVMKSILVIVFQIVSNYDNEEQRQKALEILTNTFEDSADQLKEILAWNVDSLSTPFSAVIWQKRNVRFTTSEFDSAPLDWEVANENILSYQIIDDPNDPRVRVSYTDVTTATTDSAEEITIFHATSMEYLQSLKQFLAPLIGNKEILASGIDHERSPPSPVAMVPSVVIEEVLITDVDQEECSQASIASELYPSESEIFAEKINDYNDQVSGSLVPSPRSADARECYEESESNGDHTYMSSEANTPMQHEPRSIPESPTAPDPYNIELAREQSVSKFKKTNWRARLRGKLKDQAQSSRATHMDSVDLATGFTLLQSSTPIRRSKRLTYQPNFGCDADENAPDSDDNEEGVGGDVSYKPWNDRTQPRSQIRVKYVAETLTTTGVQGKFKSAAKARVLAFSGSMIRTNTQDAVAGEAGMSKDWEAINEAVQRQLCALDSPCTSAELEERRRPLYETENDNTESTVGSPPKKRAALSDVTNTGGPRLALIRQEFENPEQLVQHVVNTVAKPMVSELNKTLEKNRQETEAVAVQIVESAEADYRVIMQKHEKYSKLMGEATNTLAEMSQLALEYRRKHVLNSNIDSLIEQTAERDKQFADTVRAKREELEKIQNTAFTFGWRLHRQIYLEELAKFVSEFD
ncbi:uncharacterized protein LOC131208228 [Anopheles bellator]|uniref:uncharacterized protein LOC131208228 n=1 Tax=Anopheles bellator TaxID=139047 RepID=UPI00264770A7|nr:uncharacterized protein LOC131208228 [Anopheles bellator]